MRKKGLLLAAVLVVLLAFGFWFYSKLKIDEPYVFVFAERYFSNLRDGQVNAAFAMYSEDFRRNDGDRWRAIIDQLDAQNGTVQKFKVLDGAMGTVKLYGSETAHCVIVVSKVVRKKLKSEEKLTIFCNEDDQCTIVGHEIHRLDNGAHLSAGSPGVEIPHS